MEENYRMTWLRKTFGPRIYTRFAIASQYFLPQHEAVDEWYTSSCLWVLEFV